MVISYWPLVRRGEKKLYSVFLPVKVKADQRNYAEINRTKSNGFSSACVSRDQLEILTWKYCVN